MKVLLKILKKKNQTGFSLIELMIVVVIIGILSTIAIPQYQNFQLKAKQSEAKANLGGLYTTMKTFQAEWNQYYGDFRALGYAVSGTYNYNIGFTANAKGPATHPELIHRGTGTVISTVQYCKLANSGCKASAAVANIPASAIKNAGAVQTFKGGAGSNIDADVTLDQWNIDELKQLTHITNDINL